MPHSCTSCGRAFPEGSTDMLSGCPDCGGNRFQFVPESATDTPDESADDTLIEADDDPDAPRRVSTPGDDPAQADARSSMVDPTQLPTSNSNQDRPESEAADDPEPSPDLDELRSQLEDRFESIKILERGRYELNLQELYNRRECIIELQEDGRYAIEVPETLTDA